MNYSPSPWKVSNDFKYKDGEPTIGVISAKSGCAVAWPCGPTLEQHFANAQLIAAAPELLEALKWAMKRIDSKARHQAIEGDGELYAFMSALGAIAKATGERT